MSVETSKVNRVPLAEAPTFGKYHLIAKLGQGGMADVFLAIARGPAGFNKLVVIKRLKSGVSEEAEFHGMFMDEARLAARLNHPNVVQTNEVGQAASHYYLAMEYLEGQPLNRIMTRIQREDAQPNAGSADRLPVLLRIVCDALAGLQYAHEITDYDGTPLRVVHRDVSPHNIFVTYDGVAKVVDFGIAKAAVRSAYTSTGVVKGKISYMAPEQALSAPIDHRADVFSMGVILWELVAGERLWGSLSEVQILQKMAFGEVPALASRKADVPPELSRICSRALAMVAGERYGSAAEMREDIERFIKQHALSAATSDVGTLVGEMFKDRRAEVKTVIQEQLRGMTEDGALPVRDVSIPDIAMQTDSRMAAAKQQLPRVSQLPDIGAEPHKPFDATPSASGIMHTNTTGSLQRPRPRRLGPVVLGALGVIVLGVGGALLLLRLRDGSAAPAPAATETARPAETVAAMAAPAGSRVDFRVEATPDSATIYLDEVAVGDNPFGAKFAADGMAHRLRIEAPGHKPHTRLVVFDRDISLAIALEPDTPRAPTPETTASASATPSARPTAPPPGPRPGGRLPPKGGPKGGTKVDPTDPFK